MRGELRRGEVRREGVVGYRGEDDRGGIGCNVI